MKKLSLLTLALAALAGTAHAATVDDSFRVSIEIRESCAVSVAAADVNYGQTNRSAAAVAGSTLSVNCTTGTPWVLGLDNGQNAEGAAVSATNRRMSSGSGFVPYGLFRDASRSQLFGSTAGTDTASGTGTGDAQSVSVFGQVQAASTNVAAGVYQDTVVAQVTY